MGRKKHVVEEEEQKGYEALAGGCEPDWWHRADKHQTTFASAIEYYDVTTVDAEAGTGKTTIAVMMGLKAIKEGKADVLRYVRFVDQRTQKLGYLPGELQGGKELGFMHPFLEALAECGLRPEDTWSLAAKGVIEMSTDIHFRGRNMKRTFMIVDECQNGSIDDMQLTFTRVHDDGKLIAIGHSAQMDRKLPRYGKDKLTPFQVYAYHYAKKNRAKTCELVKNYRGWISQWADKINQTIEELESEQ